MKTYTLPNGIKIVHQYMPGVAVSHCGLILKFGSRNEKENEHGIAHLIEHCLFKGTEKRKAYHILSQTRCCWRRVECLHHKRRTLCICFFY